MLLKNKNELDLSLFFPISVFHEHPSWKMQSLCYRAEKGKMPMYRFVIEMLILRYTFSVSKSFLMMKRNFYLAT